jgi:uncharacterized membrane protein YccC
VSATAALSPVGAVPELPSPRSRQWEAWVDRFVGSDPGLNRFRRALEVAVSLAAAIGGEWLFVRTTSALLIDTHGAQLSAAQATLVHTQHYGILLIAMALGPLMAQLGASVMTDATVAGQLVSSLFVPAPTLAGITLGLTVSDHRLLSLVLMVAFLGGGAYLRRFGHRGVLGGVMLFIGVFFGYFLHAAVTTSDMGWLAAEAGVGSLIGIGVHFALFFPRHDQALRRAQRSYAARARRTARLALTAFDAAEGPDGPTNGRLRRQFVRLNEAALIVDAQLANPAAPAPGASAWRLHERIFDIELAMTNAARFAQAMSRMDLSELEREAIRRALFAIQANNLPAARRAGQDLLTQIPHPDAADNPEEQPGRISTVIPHRFAGVVIALADALTDWAAIDRFVGVEHGPDGLDEPAFRSSVRLAGGWLPGSAFASAQASTEIGPHRWDRIRLKPHTRTAIQITVAGAIAVAAGDALSGPRFYWALIAVMITFLGTNNTGEQTRKATFRVAGTIVGVAIGIGLAHAVGHHTNWTIAVILLAMFFGFYLMRINYAFFVVFLVIALSQLYVQLGDFTNTLLFTRLAETALGAVIAILTVTFVLPLRTRHVLQVAMRAHLTAMAALVSHATEQLLDHDSTVALRGDARALDAAHQTLLATVQPLRQNMFGELDEQLGEAVGLAGAYRNYGRNLVTDLDTAPDLDNTARHQLQLAGRTLNDSINVLVRTIGGPRSETYIRSAALFDQIEQHLEARNGRVADNQLAVRDFKLIDEAMASLATAMNLTVVNYDTATIDLPPQPA